MKWILITGAAKRLGASLAVSLAQEGYAIAVHYCQSQKEAENVVDQCLSFGVQATSIQGDFSSTDSVQNFIQRYLKQFPQTYALINNVGNYLVKPTLETEIEQMAALFQTNLQAPFAIARALIPSLIENQGQIISLGVSGLNHFSANTYASAYYLSKLGLLGLTRSLAKELAPYNVCVNMVSPGYLENSVDFPNHPNKIPMQRPGTCSEVARVITFLLDPLNHYVTGQNIEVAGGVGL